MALRPVVTPAGPQSSVGAAGAVVVAEATVVQAEAGARARATNLTVSFIKFE
jgi:hypothetical protein